MTKKVEKQSKMSWYLSQENIQELRRRASPVATKRKKKYVLL
uniref:Uncharacterized protein n=1 Tax=Arundo donax TaxID=35708 RepID=A0A0A8YMK6_ARUDO